MIFGNGIKQQILGHRKQILEELQEIAQSAKVYRIGIIFWVYGYWIQKQIWNLYAGFLLKRVISEQVTC